MAGLPTLPTEIRAIIIDHYTTLLPSTLILPPVSSEYSDLCDFPSDQSRADQWIRTTPCPEILLMNRAFYIESLPVIYSRSTIQLHPELLSHSVISQRPGMAYIKTIDLNIRACLPNACVWYSDSLTSTIISNIRTYLPQVTSIGLSIRDGTDWSKPLPAKMIEHFLSHPSWTNLIRRVSLKIEGRNRYAMQAFLQSSRISRPRPVNGVQWRRKSILNVPFAIVQLPELEELTLSMVTSLSAPGQHDTDTGIATQGSNPRNGRMEQYTPSDCVIKNQQNQDFVIALKINELFHAAGKNVTIHVKRCIWTEGFGGYVVEEKTLGQYSRERWESCPEFASELRSRAGGDQVQA